MLIQGIRPVGSTINKVCVGCIRVAGDPPPPDFLKAALPRTRCIIRSKLLSAKKKKKKKKII